MSVAPIIEHVKCSDCPIRARAVCARCDDGELALLDAIKTYRSIRAGETIIWAGDEMTFLGSIVTGVATLSQTLEDGRRQMLGLLLPSDFIGRPGRATAQFEVTAVTDILICQFNKPKFEELIRTTPHIAERLLEMTMDELDAAREWMLILGRKTAREKIASFLVILARRQASLSRGGANGVRFELPITREAMADYLGLTIETVSRQISALRKAGLIEIEGLRRVTVPDFAALMDETGDDSDGGIIA